MEFHPYANLFPMMNQDEMKELRADMRENGYRPELPIIVYEGMILDGRNRYTAALAEGIEPNYQEFRNNDDPLKYVIRLNLHRRHLDTSQRAMCAARLANMPSHRPTESGSIDLLSQSEAAKMLNVSVPSVKRAKQVLETSTPELIAKVDSGEVAVWKVVRDSNRRDKLETISKGNKPLENSIGLFNVILADPPWRYDHPISESRMIENQYPTMDIQDILKLPVKDITAQDAIIFLWASTPMLRKGILTLDAWGFDYRTSMVWVKPSIGPGQWVRQRHELLLIGITGNIPTPFPGARPDSVIEAPREEHSKKPDIVYSIIETMYPSLRKVELFSRNKRDGWESWGNQA